MLLNTSGFLRGRLPIRLVVLKEDVLEARLIARQRHDRIARRGLDDSVGRSLDGDAHGVAVVQRLDLDDAVHRLERVGRHWLSEKDRDLVALDVLQLVHAADADEPTLADDADALARLLDLAQ